MAIVSRLQLNHPTLGTAGGAGLHSSIESLYTKIGDNMADRWFAITDFDQTEVVDLLHNFETDINNLRYDLYNFTGGEWVRLTAATSPARSAFSVIEKVGSEATTLQITNNTGGNNLTFAVGITFDSISLADSDIKDVDIVTTSPEDGQSLVWDSVSSKFKPGASGDSSFKLQGVTDPNVTIKGGYLLLDDGREIATYAGSGTAATDFGTDIVVNLDTVLGSNPVNATTYYLYLNLLALGSEVTIDNGRKVYSVAAADTSKFYLSTTKPEAIKKSQYSVIGFIKSATTGTVWSGSGSAFGTIASKKFNQRKVESYNYLFDFYTAQSLGTVGNGNVSDTGNRSLSTLEEWQSTNTTNISLSASSSSPLRSPFNFLFTGSGNNATGTTFIESPAFQLHVVDLGNPVMVSFDLADVTADGNFDVCMVRYNSSGTYQEKISIAGNASGATPASAKLPLGTTKFNGFFISSSTSTDYYALRIRRLAGADVPRMDSIKVSPDTVIQGAAVTDWVAFTPTGSWSTNTTYSGFCRQVGNYMEGEMRLLLSGAPTSATLTVNIPNSLTIDTTRLPDQTNNQSILGNVTILDSGTAKFTGIALYNNATSLVIRYQKDNGTAVTHSNVTQAAPMTFTSSDEIHISFRLPITGWSSSVTMANRAVEEYAYNSSTNDGNDYTSFAYGLEGKTFVALTASASKRVRFKTVVQPTDQITLEVWDDTSSMWYPHTANRNGSYAYNVQGTTNYGMWFTGVNSTDIDVTFATYANSTGASYGSAGSAWGGHTSKKWRVRKVSGGASVGFPVSARNVVGDVSGTAVPSGYIGETIIISRTYAAKTAIPATGVAGNVIASTLNLTAGKWEISGAVGMDVGGVPTITDAVAFVSTTSATFPGFSSLLTPDSSGQMGVSAPLTCGTSGHTISIPPYELNINTTNAPLYLGVKYVYSGGSSLTMFGYLKARRIA